MIMYLRGQVPLDSKLMSSLFVRANTKLKSRAVDFLGRGLGDEKGSLSTELVGRAKAFWEYRLKACTSLPNVDQRQELKEFGWWMESKYYGDEWLLDQAIQVLALAHHITPEHVVMDRLVELAYARRRPGS